MLGIDYKGNKGFRLLNIYERLNKGEILKKEALANDFCVSQKTIQRDIDDLRAYLKETHYSEVDTVIKYSRSRSGYYLVRNEREWFTNQEVTSIIKILLESRAFQKEELTGIIDKLLMQTAEKDRRTVKEIILNEYASYIPPRHNKPLLQIIWQLTEHITRKNIIEFNYRRQDGLILKKQVKGAFFMFNMLKNLERQQKLTYNALAELGQRELEALNALKNNALPNISNIKNFPNLQIEGVFNKDIEAALAECCRFYPSLLSDNRVMAALYGAIPTANDFLGAAANESELCFGDKDELAEFSYNYFLKKLNLKPNDRLEDSSNIENLCPARFNRLDVLCGGHINELLNSKTDEAKTDIEYYKRYLSRLETVTKSYTFMVEMSSRFCEHVAYELNQRLYSDKGNDWTTDYTPYEQTVIKKYLLTLDSLYLLCSTPLIITNKTGKNKINKKEILNRIENYSAIAVST